MFNNYLVTLFTFLGIFSLSISGENCQLMIQRTNRTLYKGQVRFFPHIINTHHSYNTAIMLIIIRLLVRLSSEDYGSVNRDERPAWSWAQNQFFTFCMAEKLFGSDRLMRPRSKHSVLLFQARHADWYNIYSYILISCHNKILYWKTVFSSRQKIFHNFRFDLTARFISFISN